MRRTDTASRTIPAGADAIYGAFTDPERLVTWLPPGNMKGRVLEYDFREGGRYRIELSYDEAATAGTGKTSARTDVSAGRFVKLEPGKRIVQSAEFESSDASFAGEMTISWTFEPTMDGTRVTVAADDVPPGITKEDHDAGLRASLENLARHVDARRRGRT